MGTRGYIIYIIRNKIYYQYNHWDSYPDGLGRNLTNCIIALLKIYTFKELKQKIYDLEVVYDDTNATPDQIEKLKEYSNTTVSTQKMQEWYVLLRECQGNLDLTLKSGYILSSKFDNIKDCDEEYVYVVNLNDDKFYCNNELIGSVSKIPENWYEVPEEPTCDPLHCDNDDI